MEDKDKIIAALKAENDRLKEENKTLEQFLSKEPLALQALQKGYASYKKSTDVFYEMVKTYKQTLQEIKEIAEKPKLFKDFSEIKTATEVEYDYAAICNELELRLYKVLELITKAESEG